MDNQPLAIVTGAAHRLGRTLALSLAKQGYAILVHYYSSEEDAKQTVVGVESFGVPGYLVRCDLSTEDGIDEIINVLDSNLSIRNSPLCVLVNSASIMHKGDLNSIRVADWDSTFALNLRAPYLLAIQAARRMINGGIIVNISDTGAQKLWTSYPAYVISKSSLESLTKILAKGLAPKIRVNAIAPGLVLPSEKIEPDEWVKLIKRSPLQRATAPEDIASALEFLIKNESMTGQTIVVDGGYSLI
jgi:pteridine reductase